MLNFTDFVIVELTYDCNLKCSYCYLQYATHKHSKDKMSVETFKDFIDELIEKRKINKLTSRVELVLHGGEPTLVGHESLYEMITYAREESQKNNLDFYITIQTNGINLTEDFIPAFKKLDSVGISFDGVGEAFDMRTSNKSIKEKIINSLEILKRNDINYGFVSVISKKNVDNLNIFESEYFKRAKLIPIYDTNDGATNLEPGEFFEKIIKKDFERSSYIDGSMSSSTFDRIFKRVFVDLMFEHTDTCQSTCDFRFCGAGMRIAAIQPDGTVLRCDRWTLNEKTNDIIKFGNYKTYDFLGIKKLRAAVSWNKMLSEINKEDCDTCYAKYACQSDCQALHFSRHDSFGIDKRVCTQTKLMYDYVESNLIKIINDFIDNNKGFVFEEDKIFNVKMRKGSLLEENNIRCSIKKDEENEFKSIVTFGRF